MKTFIKISSLILVVSFFFACEEKNGIGYNAEENIGWIQFAETNDAIIQVNTETQPSFNVPVDIQVPVVAEDLTISYNLVPVSGLDPNDVFSNDGTIVSPAGESSYAGPDNNTGIGYVYLANIEFDVSEIPFITELMVFDVVLTATNNANITVGLAGADKPIVQRVSILCANPDSIPDDYFVGDYMLMDAVATIGPGNGTENFESGIVTLAIDPFNPNARTFSAAILPAFVPAQQFITIEFADDDTIKLGLVGSGIACGAGNPEYIYVDAGANSTLWSICNDDDVVTIKYTEDPDSSCGGPYDSSFTLTRQ
ncbi:hypothetical protein [Psychroserpens sp.]|uniref:hypothetical protein n=1 Tax=Psychroserpens sp. TaxID=2020870 RepID=UPI002B27A6D5|nr:hypothetical protein [Psychroserpens sp.]